MNTKLGAHITTGSRDGWGTAAPFLRGAVSFLADAFREMSPNAFRVWRHQGYTWQGQTVLDIMPGFDQLTIDQMPAQAAYWWPIIHQQVLNEEARLGIRFDAIKMTNEVGGGGNLPDTDYALMKLVAYEQALLPLAEADGRILAVANCATDSPQWDDWELIIAPFIIEAASRGHIYSRHAYSDTIDGVECMAQIVQGGLVAPAGNDTARPFQELEYFRSLGYRIPTILGECGFYKYPGEKRFIDQMGLYDQLMQNYDELGFGSIFTYGVWGQANIEQASPSLANYCRERPFVGWLPEFVGPDKPPDQPPSKHKAIVVKLPQTMTREEWQTATAVAYDFRHTVTASHDDMMTVLHGGNDESFVKASHPDRDAEALKLVVDAGYKWEPLYNEEQTFKLVVWPTEFKTVTQEFGANPANYAPYGLPGHEGIDIRAPHGTKVFAAVGGRVFAVETNPDAHNYGIHCRIEHEGGYQTIYAHMMELFVSAGETVGSGALLGLADNTGNSFGDHLHFGMKHYPDGMTGWPSNIIDPTPFLKPLAPEAWEPDPPPPMGETINIRSYFEPVYEYGPMKVIAWLDGSKTQPQQLIKRGGSVLEAKGEGEWVNGRRYDHYERYEFVFGEMRRHEDTSMGSLQAYTQNGERWLPEVVTIGRQYVNSPRITVRSLVNCSVLSDATTTDYLTVTKRHATWDTPAGTINNVIEVEWRKSPTGPVEEIYFYGANIGLVGWGVGTLEAVLSELPQGRTPLNPALWFCG